MCWIMEAGIAFRFTMPSNWGVHRLPLTSTKVRLAPRLRKLISVALPLLLSDWACDVKEAPACGMFCNTAETLVYPDCRICSAEILWTGCAAPALDCRM